MAPLLNDVCTGMYGQSLHEYICARPSLKRSLDGQTRNETAMALLGQVNAIYKNERLLAKKSKSDKLSKFEVELARSRDEVAELRALIKQNTGQAAVEKPNGENEENKEDDKPDDIRNINGKGE